MGIRSKIIWSLSFPLLVIILMIPADLFSSSIVSVSSTVAGEEKGWEEWIQKYPELNDYGGIPLKLLYGTSYDDMYEKGWQRNFEVIVTKYPHSKVAIYARYRLLSGKTREDMIANMRQFISEYGKEVFPKVCDEFLTAWYHLPQGGMSVGALTQSDIAANYYSIDDYQAKPSSSAIIEWKKVLAWYPKRFNSDNTEIPHAEWTKIIYPAYFTLLEIYDELEEMDKAILFEDEILKLPNYDFGNNYGKNAHAEVYLRKAGRLAKKGNSKAAMGYYDIVASSYTNISWGYHAGIGDYYYLTAIKNSIALSPIDRVKFIKEFLNKNPEKKSDSLVELILAGTLFQTGDTTEAKVLLKKLFEEDPGNLEAMLINPSYRHFEISWFPAAGQEYFKKLKKTVGK